MLDLLTPEELRAVVAHERAHARGRHDLVLLPFVALRAAVPWVRAVRTAREAVPVLLEMLADDRARRVHGDLTLARALVGMAAPSPGAGFALAEQGIVQRVERLVSGGERPATWVAGTAYACAGILLSGPLAVLIAPIVCA